MTRFGLTQKALVNHQARHSRLFPAESGTRPTESWRGRESPARDLPHNRRIAENPRRRRAVIFHINDASLLIVPALFFIQRLNGEVAEWSKALPC